MTLTLHLEPYKTATYRYTYLRIKLYYKQYVFWNVYISKQIRRKKNRCLKN